MKIKKGDKVKVISGKDRGKTGAVVRVFPEKDRVLVEGVGKVKRHTRARKGGQKGQIVEKPTPIHVSNVLLVDPKSGVPTRIGISRDGKKRIRVAKKSGASLEK